MQYKIKPALLIFIWSFQLLCSRSLAQTVTLGVFGGPNYTFMWRSDGGRNLPAINYAAGISAEYSLPGKFSLLSSPRFEVKGSATSVDLTDEQGNTISDVEIKEKLNYLTLPVLFKGTFGKKLKFIAGVGLYASWLLSSEYTLGQQTAGSRTDEYQRFDGGGSVLLGGEFPISPKFELSLFLSHETGLSNISIYGSPALQNDATGLFLGLAYSIGKSTE